MYLSCPWSQANASDEIWFRSAKQLKNRAHAIFFFKTASKVAILKIKRNHTKKLMICNLPYCCHHISLVKPFRSKIKFEDFPIVSLCLHLFFKKKKNSVSFPIFICQQWWLATTTSPCSPPLLSIKTRWRGHFLLSGPSLRPVSTQMLMKSSPNLLSRGDVNYIVDY